MFLDAEWAWVKWDTQYLNTWHVRGPEASNGKCKQKRNILFDQDESAGDCSVLETDTYAADADGRVTEEEELVHAWYNHCPQNAHDPRTDGGCGHVKVICVGDCRSNFRVW